MRSGADGGGTHRCGLEDAMDVVEESAMLHNRKKSSRSLVLWISGGRRACRRPGAAGREEDSPQTTRSYLSFRSGIRERTEEQNPVPFVHRERFLERLVEVIVDIPVPRVQEDISRGDSGDLGALCLRTACGRARASDPGGTHGDGPVPLRADYGRSACGVLHMLQDRKWHAWAA